MHFTLKLKLFLVIYICSVIIEVHGADDRYAFNLLNIFNITTPTNDEKGADTDTESDNNDQGIQPNESDAEPDPCDNFKFLIPRIGGNNYNNNNNEPNNNCLQKIQNNENNYNECGIRIDDGLNPRLTQHSTTSQIFEFPWMISISFYHVSTGAVYHTGGSLIHPSVVMTVAHKVHGHTANRFMVKAGIWDMNEIDKDNIYPSQDRNVSQVIIHEDFNYNRHNLHYDIALLKLDKPFEITANVRTICLPPPNQNFDNEECTVSGWGRNAVDGNYQAQLKKLDLPVVPNNECQRLLRTTSIGTRFTLHDSFLCAGGRLGEDACDGDGGSPLVCPISKSKSNYYQVGIVAAGRGCGTKIPGVYTNVGYLRDWIDRQIINLGFNTLYYTPTSEITS